MSRLWLCCKWRHPVGGGWRHLTWWNTCSMWVRGWISRVLQYFTDAPGVQKLLATTVYVFQTSHVTSVRACGYIHHVSSSVLCSPTATTTVDDLLTSWPAAPFHLELVSPPTVNNQPAIDSSVWISWVYEWPAIAAFQVPYIPDDEWLACAPCWHSDVPLTEPTAGGMNSRRQAGSCISSLCDITEGWRLASVASLKTLQSFALYGTFSNSCTCVCVCVRATKNLCTVYTSNILPV